MSGVSTARRNTTKLRPIRMYSTHFRLCGHADSPSSGGLVRRAAELDPPVPDRLSGAVRSGTGDDRGARKMQQDLFSDGADRLSKPPASAAPNDQKPGMSSSTEQRVGRRIIQFKNFVYNEPRVRISGRTGSRRKQHLTVLPRLTAPG